MATTILDYLESSTRTYPDKTAYSDSDRNLTYRATMDLSRRIATKLLTEGAYKEPVVVFMRKNALCLPAFYGIAYSGCFYTVIDIDMPSQRINRILEILRPRFALVEESTREALDSTMFQGTVISIEDCFEAPLDHALVENARVNIVGEDLLYVLFTSGSTGAPKGVSIRHNSVVDYIDQVVDVFDFDDTLRIANQAPFYFDHSVLDLYAAPKVGGTMFVVPQKTIPYPVKLLRYLVENEINCIFWVPTIMIIIANMKALPRVHVPTLKKILIGGEVMPVKQLNQWISEYPDALIANLYGPTEVTVDCTYYIVNRRLDDSEKLPIGNAFKNTEILVFDDEDRLIPPEQTDIVGELCVRGVSVAAGYYNDPERTDLAFVQNPLHTSYRDIIYRTGDLVSYNVYGEIEYHARKDHQIKRSGYRIELGEIETAASSHPHIERCCCIFDEETNKLVLLYEGADVNDSVLLEHLHGLLQEYMIPNVCKCLPTLPINANGKIDRAGLKADLVSYMAL